jgi:hypothetical protein
VVLFAAQTERRALLGSVGLNFSTPSNARRSKLYHYRRRILSARTFRTRLKPGVNEKLFTKQNRITRFATLFDFDRTLFCTRVKAAVNRRSPDASRRRAMTVIRGVSGLR